MKIIQIHLRYFPDIGGGAEITLKALAEGLARSGHEVSVLTLGPKRGIHEEVINGVRVIRAGFRNVYWHHRPTKPAPALLRAIWHTFDIYNRPMASVLEKIFRKEKADVALVHNIGGWSVAAYAALQRLNIPIVQVLHEFYWLCPNCNMFRNGKICATQCGRCKMFRLFHPQQSGGARVVVGVSDFVLQKHLQSGYFSNAVVQRAIHNARQLDEIPPRRNRPAKDDGKIRFGFIGTLSAVKGIEVLARVFTQLALPNAELLVAGHGKNDFESQLRQKFCTDEIIFLGYQQPEVFFPMIDILVVPSLWNEALGMVVPEALAFGVPVVGSRRGGIPEMIDHGVNGFLFDPDSPEELAALIKDLAGNPERIEALREFAQATAQRFLDVNAWIKNYNDVLAQATAPEK